MHLRVPVTYRRHDGLTIRTLDIAEWHFGALILVDPDLWVVDVWDLLQSNYSLISIHLIHRTVRNSSVKKSHFYLARLYG